MKKLIAILFMFMLLIGCKPTQYIPIEHQTVITYKDSTIYHQDTIHVQLEKEAYTYYSSLLDTIMMETQYSYATAYIDTTNKLLNGTISNKHIDLPVIYKWKDRIITNDTTIYQDRPMYIEVPDKKAQREADVYKLLFYMMSGFALVFGITIIIKNHMRL